MTRVCDPGVEVRMSPLWESVSTHRMGFKEAPCSRVSIGALRGRREEFQRGGWPKARTRVLGGASAPSRCGSGPLSASGSADQLQPLPLRPRDAFAGGSPEHSENARPAFHRPGPGSAETLPGKTVIIINKNNDNSCHLWGPF